MSQRIILKSKLLFSNRIMLLCNIAILLLIFFTCFWPKYRVERSAAEQAKEMGLRLYFGRPPFFLFVDNDFPSKEGFTLLQKGNPLIISDKEYEHVKKEDKRVVSVSLGTDFSMACKYDPFPATKITEYTISLESSAITDLNVDGIPDMRALWMPAHKLEVWYQGEWVEVQIGGESDKYHKRLIDGTAVTFNAENGVWLLQAGVTH